MPRPNPLALTRRDLKLWKSMSQVEVDNGGREALAEKLSLADLTPQQQAFIELMQSPERFGDSLASLARQAGLSPFGVSEMFHNTHKYAMVKGAQKIAADRVEGVMTDITEKAVDRRAPCPCTMTLAGGTCPVNPQCAECHGKGFVFKESSIDRQELVLKTLGMLPKEGGVTVQNRNQVLVTGGGTSVFDAFIKAADRVQDTVTDVTVIDV